MALYSTRTALSAQIMRVIPGPSTCSVERTAAHSPGACNAPGSINHRRKKEALRKTDILDVQRGEGEERRKSMHFPYRVCEAANATAADMRLPQRQHNRVCNTRLAEATRAKHLVRKKPDRVRGDGREACTLAGSMRTRESTESPRFLRAYPGGGRAWGWHKLRCGAGPTREQRGA